MPEPTVSQRVLDNGLTVVEMPVAGRLAAAVTLALPAGAGHERPDEVGAAHLLEHLAFKGTEAHPTATGLNRAIEYLGTELEGSTNVDYVEFSTWVRAEASMAALELLGEVVATPRLPAAELERERAVVLQEIADSDESPAFRASDLLNDALFAGHRRGVDIAGRAEHVERLTHAQLLGFRARQWSPAGGVAVFGGNLQHLDRDRVDAILSAIPACPLPPQPLAPPPFVPRIRTEELDGEVAHLRLAYEVPGLHLGRRRDRAIAEVLSQLLGGPMGSRLVDELREREALCYWIDGYLWGYGGTGYLSVQCSVDHSRAEEAVERINRILAELRRDGPTEEEGRRFQAYSTGAVALDLEGVGSQVDHAVELIMEYGDEEVDPLLYLREVESVKRSEVAGLASRIGAQPCIACVGPVAEGQLAGAAG